MALGPKPALALSLAIHELAINAVKYGALSVPAGRVDISWQYDDSNRVELLWRESGGPTVSTPRRQGFGSTLIKRALALETGGAFEARLRPGRRDLCDQVPRKLVDSIGRLFSQAAANSTGPSWQQGSQSLTAPQKVVCRLFRRSSLHSNDRAAVRRY